MFSRAEQGVIDLLKTGLSNQEIADRLFVTEKTVKFHLTSIYSKIGAKSRTDFILKYQQQYEGRVMERNIDSGNIPVGSKPVDADRITTIQEARRIESGPRQVVQKSQEDKITFINDKFRVSDTITHLHGMMKDVTSKEITPSTVNAACNCVSRLNETINTAIAAARFLSER